MSFSAHAHYHAPGCLVEVALVQVPTGYVVGVSIDWEPIKFGDPLPFAAALAAYNEECHKAILICR